MTKRELIFYIVVVTVFFSSMIASIHGYIDLVSIVSIYVALAGILLASQYTKFINLQGNFMTKRYDNFIDELEAICEKHGVVLVCSHSGTCIEVHSSGGRTICEAEVYEDCTDD